MIVTTSDPTSSPRFVPGAGTWSEVRRLALAELDESLQRSTRGELGVAQLAHEMRKSIKRLRALLLLVKGPLRRCFAELDGCLREVAHGLAPIREAEAARETLAALAADAGPERRDAHARARASFALDGPRESVARALVIDARSALRRLRERVLAWPELDSGFELLERGYRRTYRRCRRALRRALGRGRLEDFHELRKAIKAHQHQLGWFTGWDAPELDARRRATAVLSQLLGDHHDLGLLALELRGRGFADLARDADARVVELERAIVEEATVYAGERARAVSDELRRAWCAGAP